MGKGAKEQLNRALTQHLNIIHETFQILDQTPASSVEKVSWKEVIQMGEQISKYATTVGMLYAGETPGVEALLENMASYFNLMQGLLLLSHGSLIGAGPTLSSSIHESVKRVVDSSFMLLQEAVSSYGSSSKKSSIPQLAGAVWDACSALKKTPSSNVTAIGRAMTQVTVSIKDVLRELKELKPADEASDLVPPNKSNINDDSDEDLGSDLSPDEMKIVQLTISLVSEILVVTKELIRSVTCMLRHENSNPNGNNVSVDSLEKLLKLCQEMGVQVDDLGACLYPPQELSSIKMALGKISNLANETEAELVNLAGACEDFSEACSVLRDSLKKSETELTRACPDDLVPEMENLVVCS